MNFRHLLYTYFEGLLCSESSSSILNKLFIPFGMLFETNFLHLTSHDNVEKYWQCSHFHFWFTIEINFLYVATAQLLRYDNGTNIRDRIKSILILSNEFDHIVHINNKISKKSITKIYFFSLIKLYLQQNFV